MAQCLFRKLRLSLWWYFFCHPELQYRVYLRKVDPLPGTGWKPYWAFVNRIKTPYGNAYRTLGAVNMLAMAEAEDAKHRRDFPSAAGMYEKFMRDIRLQMDMDME